MFSQAALPVHKLSLRHTQTETNTETNTNRRHTDRQKTCTDRHTDTKWRHADTQEMNGHTNVQKEDTYTNSQTHKDTHMQMHTRTHTNVHAHTGITVAKSWAKYKVFSYIYTRNYWDITSRKWDIN